MIRTLATLMMFGFVGLFLATEAQAQYPYSARTVRQETMYNPGMTAVPAPVTRVYSYSYYTRSNLPVRTYVGYGDNDFPYHGAPYGHPYDPWTWPAMSGSYQAGLTRYYSPPLK